MNPRSLSLRPAPHRRTSPDGRGNNSARRLEHRRGRQGRPGWPTSPFTAGRCWSYPSAVVGPRPGAEDSYPRVFDLTMTISNIGSITASHVVGTVPDNVYVGTESGSSLFGYTYIYPGKSVDGHPAHAAG